MASSKEAERLANQAYEHLADGDYDAAMAVAKQLESLGADAAFEIAAEAYAAQGEPNEAVKALQRGVEQSPNAWLNWQLLGNYHSDLEQYEEAAAAYDRALRCPEAWVASIRLNLAILATRLGRYDEAIGELDAAGDDESLRIELAAARIRVLQEAGRIDEALAAAGKVLQGECDELQDGPCVARIIAVMSRIHTQQGRDRATERQRLLDALDYDPSNPEVLAAIRDLDGRFSPTAQYFHVELRAEPFEADDEDEPASGEFSVVYDVVAETPEQMLDWIVDFEPDVPREAWTVTASEAVEPRPDEPLGVYWRTERLYDAESDSY